MKQNRRWGLTPKRWGLTPVIIAAMMTGLLLEPGRSIWAAETTEPVVIIDGDLTYDVNDAGDSVSFSAGPYQYLVDEEDNAIITEYSDTAVEEIMIPEYLNGHKVIGIKGMAFLYCSHLRYLSLPDTLETIESRPFPAGHSVFIDLSFDHPYFEKIDEVLFQKNTKELVYYPPGLEQGVYYVPDGVKSIGYAAFMDCDNLTEIYLPDSLEDISSEAFGMCTNLRSVQFPDHEVEIGDLIFASCLNLKNVNLPEGITEIPKQMFNGSGIEYLTIPDSVTRIGDGAFAGSKIRELTIPEGVTSIGSSTFNGCSALSYIELPEGLTEIGGYAFRLCGLTTIDLPDTVTNIGEQAFAQCKNLTSVHLPEELTEIGDAAFGNCSSLKDITIPDKVTGIGQKAFGGCVELEELTIPAGVTSIGSEAFYRCEKLYQIHLSESLTMISSYCFYGCSSLESILIPDGVTLIDKSAFENCEKLESVDIPSSVLTIGKSAFKGCSSLTFVSLPEGVVSIGETAFMIGYTVPSKLKIVVPSSVREMEGVFHSNQVILVVNKGSYAYQFALTHGFEYEATETDVIYENDWEKSYADFLDGLAVEKGSLTGFLDYSCYFLYDMDLNGTPELFVQEILGGTGVYSVYRYEDGVVMPCSQNADAALGGIPYNQLYGLDGEPGILVIYKNEGIFRAYVLLLEDDMVVPSGISYYGSFPDSSYPDEGFLPLPSYPLLENSGLIWDGNPDYDNLAVLNELPGPEELAKKAIEPDFGWISEEEYVVNSKGDTLPFLKGPDEEEEILALMNDGDELSIEAINQDWAYGQYQEQYGWANLYYLTKADSLSRSAYHDYAEVVQAYDSQYGDIPFFMDFTDEPNDSGYYLFYDLVDFDKNGREELVIGYQDSDRTNKLDIWEYKDGSAVCVFSIPNPLLGLADDLHIHYNIYEEKTCILKGYPPECVQVFGYDENGTFTLLTEEENLPYPGTSYDIDVGGGKLILQNMIGIYIWDADTKTRIHHMISDARRKILGEEDAKEPETDDEAADIHESAAIEEPVTAEDIW